MYSLCVVLASQLAVVLIIMYSPAKPTQYVDIVFVCISAMMRPFDLLYLVMLFKG